MKQQTGLGKGFESLLPQNFDNSILVDESERVQKLGLESLQPNPEQPRKTFDPEALRELAVSLKRHGLLQPIVVTPSRGGNYIIIAGERRFRAAKLAGLKTIPALVRTSEELERLEIALVENVQRVDLSPLEQAASIYKLHNQFNIEYESIAQRLGKAQTTISNVVRLLQLPKEAQMALAEGRITEGHARAILAVKDPERAQELLGLIVKNNWTVRQAEQYVTAHKSGVKETAKVHERVAKTTPETKQLEKILKTPVTVRRLAKGGKLEISFKSDQDLSRIIKKLAP